jgi:thiol-disulfide isomerase/thioredoxin
VSADRQQARRRTILVGAVVGAFVLIAVVALAVVSSPEKTFEHGDVEVRGTPLPELADGADPAVGQAAPELVGESFDGTPVAIEDDGRPKVVVFLAHWCSHCQAEVPAIQSWIDDGGLPEDVDLYSVATANSAVRGNYPPDRWLEGEGWTPPVLVDSETNQAAVAMGQAGTPFWVAVDADGRVVARTSGEIGTSGLESLIEAARAGTAVP